MVKEIVQFVLGINFCVHLVLVFVSLSTDDVDAVYERAFVY